MICRNCLHSTYIVLWVDCMMRFCQQKYPEYISPMIFKPYLTQLTLSCEIHNFHFALQLLLSFGLELFSTLEEQTLIKQLIIVATHPSLSIAHRLIALEYTKSIVIQLKPTSIDSSVLHITSSDGPDTQEKKLTILNETSIDNQNLLICMKPLKTLSLTDNIRATNAFYRVIYAFLTTKRPRYYKRNQKFIDICYIQSSQTSYQTFYQFI